MLNKIFSKFSGNHYRRFLKRSKPLVKQINEWEEQYQSLPENQIQGATEVLRQRHQNGESLDDLLPEAFATVKNAARRLYGQTFEVCGQETAWDMVHFDVQLIGGIALHQNRIAEMATGEGKTLVSTLPLYLNAISSRNCQLVTVNDYLARRDAEWMGYLFRYLGLTVGCIQNGMSPSERKEAYGCDITYGTASEFGFDYLRDNGMATRQEDQVQKDHYYIIVDEIDSILIDEARTPLIISGPVEEDRQAPYTELRPVVEKLHRQQEKFCNELASQAKEALASEDEQVRQKGYAKLLEVKKGMPKNKQLHRILENNEYHRQFERFETEMSGDFNKEAMYELKEELYFVIDEKQQQADLTEKGRQALRPDQPDAFVLPDLPTRFMEIDKKEELTPEEKQKAKQDAEEQFSKRSEEIHCLSQLLRAYSLYEKDVEYVVQDGKAIIVDENTGRLMPGRRWGDGLHQAVEAKEHVKIEKESKTYATITIQNYFRMYEKLAGMTGTAETEASEFNEIYGLEVMVIPTHKPCIRLDHNDTIYKTRREKYNRVINDIQQSHQKGQPVLVGTTSVEASELLAKMLKRVQIPHNVLNAKLHESEAQIIAEAGQKGAVTIATNMAGRGTDIKLGEGVPDAGGLCVLGTARHESRRVDRQLRGRCARQGDPGESRFYVSLEDNLMRLFANAGPISRVLESSFQEGEELQHPLLNRSIESAQKKVEQQNFSIRKRLLQYDDVLNRQREVVYGIRNEAILNERPQEILDEMLEEEIQVRLGDNSEKSSKSNKSLEPEALDSFYQWVTQHFPITLEKEELENKGGDDIQKLTYDRIQEAYQQKRELENPDAVTGLERYIVISSIDRHWQTHLTEMEELRRSVGLRGYGQKDPLQEYKSEAYAYFEELMVQVRSDICTGMFRTTTNLESFQNMLNKLSKQAKEVGPAENPAEPTAISNEATADDGSAKQDPQATSNTAPPKRSRPAPKPVRRETPKIGRNEVVTIRKGDTTKNLKYKKAETLIKQDGWELVLHEEQKS